jgi:ribosomal protein S27E
VEKEYRIECEECESVTYVIVEDKETPIFCPMCGRRAEVEDLSD